MSGQINISTPAKTYITDRHRLRIHPLPPPIIGHLTGLTCPECPINSTSQLRYHPPRFANPANINWQCHQPASNHRNGKAYIRTLNLEHLINNIRAVNAGARPPPPPGSLSGLLNMSNESPDHLNIKIKGKLCPGYLGKTGPTHHSSIKSNMKCSHNLCLSCCQMGQRVHHLTCNFKGHLYAPPSSGNDSGQTPAVSGCPPFTQPSGLIEYSEQLQIPQPSGSNPSSHKQIQSAQADRTVTSTLTPSQLLEYHQNLQAVELLAKSREAAKRVAVRTIWIELWTKPGSSTMINAEAPHWPLFSLQESQIVLDRCRKASSDDWESEIQVWNMEQFRWISLAPTCTSTYPLIPRKLLVRLEHVSDSNCIGLQEAILKMTTEGPYEPLTTPAGCILSNLPNPLKSDSSSLIDPSDSLDDFSSNLMSSRSAHVQQRTDLLQKSCLTDTNAHEYTPTSSPLPSPSKLYTNNSEIEWIGSSLEAIGGPQAQLKKAKSNAKWPDARVLLGETMRWHVTSESEGNPRDPWYQLFGDEYDYGQTTVYRVRKWISLVGKEKLELHIRNNPSLTLIEARAMYFKEWVDTRKASSKNQNQLMRKRECPGVEVEKPKKKRVNHTEDSDVEVVDHSC
ncbi:hypothetical protein PGT21_029383 [Puccinia graminis f. sp. tritici]|uniref:Uncharacterized protein n=1 Tax=Puccinia graminis f. sp. tritici TaxID=56615 RepID=A0A5B0MML1_PUCGR|nr:hypothetical protein PGT21_029383 [Puccinia graminis f. sp. tritici]